MQPKDCNCRLKSSSLEHL